MNGEMKNLEKPLNKRIWQERNVMGKTLGQIKNIIKQNRK
jgi:hypothetical protein